MTNIKKHAKARHVIIKIELMPAKINVYIKDNGCGFNIESVKPGSGGSGYGLVGMRERIQLLKGAINILSEHGKGTEINFWIPLQNE
ncbi:hypothetical protein N752_12455 [Desulforamulus aquiferis]|nr:ATP-binding protein [Desulforamulus aquiferis]RYD04731.1 hypothetical protein N752_12455 [Desulforamulus aquiferis]